MANRSALARVISPDGILPSNVSAFLLSLCFPDDLRQRYATLAAKAQSGDLTDSEQVEIDEYLEVDCIISMLKSLARQSACGAS